MGHVSRPIFLPRTACRCNKSILLSVYPRLNAGPYKPEHIEAVSEITARYPAAHGAPVHVGSPAEIGITHAGTSQHSAAVADTGAEGTKEGEKKSGSIRDPDYGEAVTVREGEECVFWACGVTPQRAIETASPPPPLAITHAPGHMFICDLLDRELKI
uniref:DUF1445 domain-containing protein n=1 Tax=Chromera velia CCMP2878 TaxID=1169474 RepID=A0A0G4HGJ1_9ALVE|eukprot:Cvel_27243.t1-p1 / transcript=Cvel_27243.t1 / gene=Cvel_27243 / organism=Chromera_velia_CCMP2878 / gene_product=UPF0317 protein Mflv_5194, putative / transcript_product=UPF0317 protein Mflv_5194, putative / location=Cvel_scaffold3373:15529-17039(-) / protein_length=157 / sequence_SO=supercontig / SO=protein_coding / is_pseudo=false